VVAAEVVPVDGSTLAPVVTPASLDASDPATEAIGASPPPVEPGTTVVLLVEVVLVDVVLVDVELVEVDDVGVELVGVPGSVPVDPNGARPSASTAWDVVRRHWSEAPGVIPDAMAAARAAGS